MKLLEASRTVYREVIDDRLSGEAAKVAYYFFLSFFPAILALFAFTGILGGDDAFRWVMRQLRAVMPGDAAQYLAQFVEEVTGKSRPGMLSLGILLTAWSASNAFAALGEGLNRMYDVEEGRAWWRRRVVALGVLGLSLLLLVVGAVLLLAGPELIALLGLSGVWEVLRWPLAFGLLTLMMWLIYLLLPSRPPPSAKRYPILGALVGAALWVAATLGFRLYLTSFPTYSKTYGFVGGVIVLLLWLYLTALTILLGGEVAATLEQLDREDWEVGRPPEAARSGRLSRPPPARRP